ncbi:dehydrogenase [Streptomyces atratus]|uniref:NADH-quinone oxidoreductase subunit C n=1 Tax=Streptomyces atratus TaxID=1893 RepID=UPI00166FAEF4|nr:NADH-quinone oxidoreductase subunit C [Streptomyces atratus]GGT15503.1 dehydrogenase [Streptomyces atratus]
MTGAENHDREGYDRLPDAAAELFGEDATAEYAYDLLTVDVPASSWTAALETARDRLGCTYFDWLSAVDEPGTGFRVCVHVASLAEGKVRRLLIRTTVPHEAAVLPTAIGIYAGAAWHERETHEMFGIGFEGHPHLVPLLLPEGFEGHPLRKDFVLAARVAKAWPGAKEPGESEHGGPKRRTMLPPGVPDPNEWGPLKGQLPPAPSRPARTPRAAGDRPVRRTRSVSEGSAGQQPKTAAPATEPTPAATPRRTRSASQGSAGQQREAAKPGTAGAGAEAREQAGPNASGTGTGTAEPKPGSSDAPWHHARPAFDTTGGPEAEPPVREGAGRGEAPRSDTSVPEATPTPDTTAPTDTPDQPEPPAQDPTPEPAPDRPAGGDTA